MNNSNETIRGIDISTHNSLAKRLDWDKIAADGIKFVIIRLGYGVTYLDPNFEYDIEQAIKRDIKVGIYHFSYALNVQGAEKEADFVIKHIEKYRKNITLPVFYDFEYDTVNYAKRRGITLNKTAFNNHAKAFCDRIKKFGYTPGVYYNLDYKKNWVNDKILGEYVQWYAQYYKTASWTGYDIWQHSSSYKIAGIDCKFDANIASPAFWDKLFNTQNTQQKQEETIINNKIYHTLNEVTNVLYRSVLDKLISKEILKGRGGSGDNLIIDFSEETIRLLVILDRAGVFDE